MHFFLSHEQYFVYLGVNRKITIIKNWLTNMDKVNINYMTRCLI